METKNKIIIAVLVIIIIALVAAIGFMFFGDMNQTKSNNTNVTVYNFDSAFTMEVPKGTVFKKSWNTSNEFIMLGNSKTYDEKGNKFSVGYIESFMVTEDFINFFLEMGNNTNTTKITHEGDLVILEFIGNETERDPAANNYTYAVLAKDGHQMVIISGNNVENLVKMAKSIEFKG